MNVHYVESLDLQILEPYRTLRRPLDHIRQGIFVAEGEKVVRRLLVSTLSVISLLLTPKWLDELRKEHSLDGIELFVADKKLVETIVGYRLHQGIMGVARVPPEPGLKDLLAELPHPFLLVAMDGIVSAENVGVVVRNCAAFGVHGILAGRSSSSPYLRRAVRNSMGAVFCMPVLHVDLPEVLPELGCRIIATTPDGGIPVQNLDLTGDLCIVFGNEGTGISTDVLKRSDVRAAIPMTNRTDSLNVASASAVFLYEIAKRSSTKSK